MIDYTVIMKGRTFLQFFLILSVIASPLLQGTAVTEVNMNKIRIYVDGIDVTDAFPSTEDYDIFVKFEYKRVFGSLGDSWTSDSGYTDFSTGWTQIADNKILSRRTYYPNTEILPDTGVAAKSNPGWEIKLRVKLVWGWFEERSQESAYIYYLYSYDFGPSSFDTGTFTFSQAGGNLQLRLTIYQLSMS